MKNFTRRDLLCHAGQVAAFGALAAALPVRSGAAQQSGEESAICLTMIYPNGKKAKFDADRYRDMHLPLIRGVYGDSVERIELRVAPPPPRTQQGRFPAPPSAFLAAVSIWIRDVEQFGKHTAAQGQQIQSDLQKVSEITPIVQYDQTIALMGEARADIPVGADCFSTYFPSKEGGRWDSKYYVEKYLPKVVETYGKSALRRIEVGRGTAGQSGAKAVMVSASHLYIRDRAAFDAAGMKAMSLFQETANYTDIMGRFVFMKVHAAG
jgi:hypothetical protein